MKLVSPVDFIDKLVKFNESGMPFSLAHHEREFLTLAYNLRAVCNVFVFSAPKKTGKTTLQALFHLWWAFTHAADEILLAANDLDQSVGRVFKVMVGIITRNPGLKQDAEITIGKIRLINGTVIEAIPNDAPSAAGANMGSTGWDELWGYTSERALRLWEELTPVPNKPSVRFVSTYAGWENESKLLWDLYLTGVDKDEHPQGQAERIHDLPIYLNQESGILAYWDHEPRMPWQTPGYYQGQKKTLRTATYLRLHENRWVSSESQFIEAGAWDACIDPNLSPLLYGATVHVGIDLGVKSDTSSVVAVCFDPSGQKLVTAFHRIWKPAKHQSVNLDDVKSYIKQIVKKHRVRSISADPSQAYLLIQQLAQEHIAVKEFTQTQANGVRMGETLFSLVRDGNLIAYKSPELREHVLNAVGIDTPGGVRMVKGKSSRKIDAAIALAMALVRAVEDGPKKFNPLAVPVGVGKVKGFDKPRDQALNQPFPGDLPAAEEREEKQGWHGVFRYPWADYY
jgi:phage terminase large subunit-like protein